MMINVLAVTISVLAYVKGYDDPEAHMTVEETVKYHGYPIETHYVITDDGYNLTLHRIPYGKNNTTTSGRKPIILQHGVVANSGVFVSNIPSKNLAYLLAEAGYDVFMPNLRGNNLARRHITLSPEDKAFWNFTFNENADHDLPAIFKSVLDLNGAEKFTYIGHSMGTTVMFIFLTKNPDYDKVTSFHALAPVAQLKNSPSPVVQTLVTFSDTFATFLSLIGSDEFLPNSTATTLLQLTLCGLPTSIICSNAIFLIMGFDNEQFNNSRLDVTMNFYPAGTSTKTMHHFAQVAKSGQFRQYDYGTKGNQKMYKQDTPPLYNVSQITRDVYMYSGDEDWLADPKDVQFLDENLKTLKEHFVVNFTKFNHADFVYAIDAVPLLYDKLIKNVLGSS